jgi:putative DNA primase/helicase
MEPEFPEGTPASAPVVDLASKRAAKAAVATSEAGEPPASEETASGEGQGRGGARRKKPVDRGLYVSMVDRFVLIYPSDTAWDKLKRKRVRIADMAHMFGSDYVRMWKASPDRKSIDEDDLVFDPSMECGEDKINLYSGLALKPVPPEEKDVLVMIELLRHLCGRCDSKISTVDEIMHWVLCWLALPFQRRGAKLATALVFHGPQGTGKNLFFDAVRDMYGPYGVMVGQTEIEEKYNGWISAKQMIIANEVVSRQELYHNKNRLKWVIDAKKIPIRTMHTDTRWEANWANMVFVSNENRPLALDIGDRRHLVVYTPNPEDKTLYDRVRAFLAAGGAAKFLHYLMEYPLEDFHEHSKPPMTEAKQELIELSMGPEARFLADWVDGFLHLPLQVCSGEQLYRAFQRWCEHCGERFIPSHSAFTTSAKRWALERVERGPDNKVLEPCLNYKVITFSDKAGVSTSGRRSMRCWLPRGTGRPDNGIPEGEWAAASADAFEGPLGRFMRSRAGADDVSGPVASSPVPRSAKSKGSE